jgi:signal transduction histidine kinase
MNKSTNKDNHIAKIKELLGYYKEITETVREPFIILDEYLRVVTANAAFYRKFKVNKKDTVGRRIYELGNNQWDAAELRELLENILPLHKVLNNYAVTHNFPKLGPRTILLNARQVDSKQLILLAMEDVTSQLKFESDISEVTASLIRQRDKLQSLNDAKDEFISLASHQLRTPATAVKQSIGMLSEGYVGELSIDQKKMIAIAYNNSDRQLGIIEDLLRVAKVDAGKLYLEKTSTDLVKLIEKVIEGQAIIFNNRHQRILFIKHEKKVMAIIDKKLISMVIENLLDNAGKYSPNGKQITIQAVQTDISTIISIQDTGVGIRKSDNVKLYKKFSRIDNPFSISVGGSGLGLYWVKEVVDLHGGTIEVTSKINVGSTFTVNIPNVIVPYLVGP